MHLGVLNHTSHSEYLTWRRRNRNELADALCHLAAFWRRSAMVVNTRPYTPGAAWHGWSDGGYEPDTGHATVGGVISMVHGQPSQATIMAAITLYRPDGASDSMTAESCGVKTVHAWISAVKERRLTLATMPDLIPNSPTVQFLACLDPLGPPLTLPPVH